MQLAGIDGNAFFILASFEINARRQGWTKEEITLVCDEATSNDYDHLLATIAFYVDEPEMDDDDEGCDGMGWDDEVLEDLE